MGMRHPDPEDFWPEGSKPLFTQDDLSAPSSRPDTPDQQHAAIVREALARLRGILRVHVLAADDALDALLALLAGAQQEVERLTAENDRLRLDPEHNRLRDNEPLIARAEAAEALAERRRVGLQAVIDYVPDGFVSPMDDEDSMNYRAIARAALADGGQET